MELKDYLKYHPHLSTKQEIDACMYYLRCFDICLNPTMEKRLYDNTPVDLHEYLKSMIYSYKQEYLERKKPKPTIILNEGRKVEKEWKEKYGLSEEDIRKLNMFSMREENRGKNLSDLGYEHGLSDW